MKQIETGMSEQRFLRRLEGLCRKKTRFCKGYEDKDTFVVKKKDDRFCLSKHYASIGRTHGYAVDCLRCRYYINENHHVNVQYRFGKRLTYLIPFCISIGIGLFLGVWALYDGVVYGNVDWNELAVTALFCGMGLAGTFIRSKKERRSLEEWLQRVCKTDP